MKTLSNKINKIVNTAKRSLLKFLLPEKNGVCFRIRKTSKGLATEGRSFRYGLITLIGVLEAKKNGHPLDFPSREIFESVKRGAANIQNPGDFGLWLWLMSYKAFIPEIFKEIRPDTSHTREMLEQFKLSRAFTYELAWLYTGVLLMRRNGLASDSVTEENLHQLFMARFNKKTSLFWQKGNKRAVYSPAPRANFADQIYSAYALALKERLDRRTSGTPMAKLVLDTLIRLQGPQGQWKWLYDVEKGTVILSYPVYSVHQDGMAPMVLVELINQGFKEYTAVLDKSISWVLGENELAVSLIDEVQGMIWRDVRFKNAATGNDYYNALVNHWFNKDSRKFKNAKPVEGLIVNYESRPYHPAWALYALTQLDGERR